MATPKKQGRMVVSFVKAGQDAQDVIVPTGATLKEALSASGMSEGDIMLAQGNVRVNTKAAELDQKLKAEDFIVLSPKVAGGR